jgi:hypothetical protein
MKFIFSGLALLILLGQTGRSERAHGGQWTTREDEYGFRRTCYTDMGINAE